MPSPRTSTRARSASPPVVTNEAILELPKEVSGFGEGNVGEVLLDIKGLSKSFGPVKANRDINLDVRRGEIVALLGENGAGKSTLVNQIFGLITPDSGTVTIKGDATAIKDPRDAIARGIGMVHQHFQLVPVMTVAENMVLGHEPVKGGQVLDIASAARAGPDPVGQAPAGRRPRRRDRGPPRRRPSSASRSSRRSRARSTSSSSTSRPRC